jgi:hypothetical protein
MKLGALKAAVVKFNMVQLGASEDCCVTFATLEPDIN